MENGRIEPLRALPALVGKIYTMYIDFALDGNTLKPPPGRCLARHWRPLEGPWKTPEPGFALPRVA